jgi:hypothetical protein
VLCWKSLLRVTAVSEDALLKIKYFPLFKYFLEITYLCDMSKTAQSGTVSFPVFIYFGNTAAKL